MLRDQIFSHVAGPWVFVPIELCYTQGMGRLSRRITLCIILLAFSGCGYHFQGNRNPLKELGVEKVYVVQFKNTTYRPGIEQLFSSAMIREIQKAGSFRLVNSREEADAILTGQISGADTSIASSKSVLIDAKNTVDVAAEYNTGVQCSVDLVDRTGRTIFSQSINSNKIYPGAARLGSEGATNALINDSEQRLAIQFLASQMMASVYQRMVDTF